MRIIFFGTPDISVPTLEMLVDAGHEVKLVITQADKRRSRGNSTSPSPVKAAALRLGLSVSHRVKDALTVEADIGVLVAFGRIIKDEILDHLNILNLHPSLLPRWRGATPVEAAILAGDTHTGVCLMQLHHEMDAGPVYGRYETAIDSHEKSTELYERLFKAGNAILRDVLETGLPTPQPQMGEATYCGRLGSADFAVDWNAPAEHIVRLSRIGRPWTTFRSKRFLILDANYSTEAASRPPGVIDGLRVATGDGILFLETVQPEGKGPVGAEAWLNGAHLIEGERLGS